MYKLTYETDEDVFGPEKQETTDRAKSSSKDNSIFDKFDPSNSQNNLTTYPNYEAPDLEEKERSPTMASTVDAVYAVVNKDKKKAATKPEANTSRKFYSLFSNSTDSIQNQEKSSSLAKGCKFCVLILYLAILTAAVIILFVSGYQLRKENYILKHRLSAFEKSVNFNAEEQKTPVLPGKVNEQSSLNWRRKGVFTAQLSIGESNKNIQPPPSGEASFISSTYPKDNEDEGPPSHAQHLSQHPSNGASCCNSARKSISIMRLKELHQSHSLETSIRRLNHIFSRTSSRLTELENNLMKLSKTMTSEMEAEKNTELQLLDINNKIETLSGGMENILEESGDDSSIERTVAFHAHRVTGDVKIDNQEIPTDKFFEFEALSPDQPFTLSYNYELINRRQDMDPKTGVFTAPFNGIYVFDISFCTTSSEQANLVLTSNEIPLHTFRVPILSPQSNTFALNPEFPPFSIPPTGINSSYTNTLYNRYSVVSELQAGQKVKLQLVSGTIVEMTSRNGKEEQSCTKFSGFKVR